MCRLLIAGALLALLPLLGGCSDGYEICAAPIAENCRKFRSRAHYERWVKEDNRRQLARAQYFPDDYRAIVAAALKDFLQDNESEWPSTRNQYFISVFGEDADTTTLAKLQQLGVEALPGSEYARNDPTSLRQNSLGVNLQGFEVYVSDLRRLASGIYRVEFGYYCGQRCAGHYAYQLRKHDGAWVFTSRKALLSS